MKYRALKDLSFRADKGGWLDVKEGEEFKPPKKTNIPQCIERGYIECIGAVKDTPQWDATHPLKLAKSEERDEVNND